MDLSVIIVNYNVRYFLEQCLHSVYRAGAGLDMELIIVDNNSTDDSISYLKERFPELIVIANSCNAGFAKACNQGLAIATGNTVLFLNPDTILAEDSLRLALSYLERHPQAGGLGVRMIDGSGTFLKESKRSFPSPLTALYKLSGLSVIFPHSRVFGRYHLGHLSDQETHEVDVLAGAFLMVPKKLLDQLGSFDESFFMYGEDVDLSYRIQKAGYHNIYFAGTTIIHFKGESTKRGSLNYVRMFYNAMNIFVRKHYGGARAGLFRGSIQLAIWIRAALAALAKGIRSIGLPVLDAAIILLSFHVVKEIWVGYVRTDIVYPEALLRISFPVYTLTYIIMAYYAGLYDRVYRRGHLPRATIFATLVLLATYALLPESWRFSRGILLFGALMAFVLIAAMRYLLLRWGVLHRTADTAEKPFLLVAATPHEYDEVLQLLEQHGRHTKVIGRVAVGGQMENAVASLENISETAGDLHAEELIFCAGALSYKEIIQRTGALKGSLRLRFHAAGSSSLVGSDSSGTSGETLAITAPLALAQPVLKRAKRLLDGSLAMVFLASFPLHLLLVKRPLPFLQHCAAVLMGRQTWVGYLGGNRYPALRPGVLAPNGMPIAKAGSIPMESRERIDYWYARDYEILQDLALIFKNYRQLGG